MNYEMLYASLTGWALAFVLFRASAPNLFASDKILVERSENIGTKNPRTARVFSVLGVIAALFFLFLALATTAEFLRLPIPKGWRFVHYWLGH
jgi:hypothetical protein